MARKDSKDRGIFERPPGSGVWWVRYHDEQGHEHREKAGPKGLALDLYRKRKTQVKEASFFPEMVGRKKHQVLLQDIIQTVLDHAKASKRSWRDDVRHAELWGQFFEGWALAEITAADIEKFVSDRRKQVMPATVNRHLAFLKHLFNIAIRDGHVDKNPVSRVRLLKENNKRTRYLDQPEIERLRTAMQGMPHAHQMPEPFQVVELAIVTGLRRSEQFRLRWDLLDFQANVITAEVSQAWGSKHGESRKVPMVARAKEILLALPSRGKSEWVFPSATMETPYDAKNWVDRFFIPALEKAGIKAFTWHCLRHSFGSYLAMKGVSLQTIGELMGHKTLQMTQRYAHLSPGHLSQAASQLDGVTAPASGKRPASPRKKR
ncbi:MAG TPA: tyrosine-type recombinase/integrase [Candidatus Xenobia bacterium]